MPLPCDVFCRAAVFPRCLKDNRLDETSLLSFSGKKLSTRSLSLASRYLCRGDDGVHDFGEKVAECGNQRKIARCESVEDEDRDVYLGFYSFLFRDFAAIASDRVGICLFWKPELDDERHFQIDLHPIKKVALQKVDDEIASEAAEAERQGKKAPLVNRERRAERLIDSEVRLIREALYKVLFGPAPVETSEARVRDLQRQFLVPLPSNS